MDLLAGLSSLLMLLSVLSNIQEIENHPAKCLADFAAQKVPLKAIKSFIGQEIDPNRNGNANDVCAYIGAVDDNGDDDDADDDDNDEYNVATCAVNEMGKYHITANRNEKFRPNAAKFRMNKVGEASKPWLSHGPGFDIRQEFASDEANPYI